MPEPGNQPEPGRKRGGWDPLKLLPTRRKKRKGPEHEEIVTISPDFPVTMCPPGNAQGIEARFSAKPKGRKGAPKQ